MVGAPETTWFESPLHNIIGGTKATVFFGETALPARMGVERSGSMAALAWIIILARLYGRREKR